MENQKTNWFQKLTSDCNSLAERFGLDDIQTQEMRDYITEVAKEQYKIGNKSGARWAFGEAEKKRTGRTQPVAQAA